MKTKPSKQKSSPTPEVDDYNFEVPAPGSTSMPRKGIENITSEFLAEKRKELKHDGSNSYIDEVGTAFRLLAREYQNQTWSLNTILQLTAHAGLSPDEVGPLYFSWLEALRKEKRVQRLFSVSSYPSFCFR